MNELTFREYLLDKKITEKDAKGFINRLKELQTFLKTDDIDAFSRETILGYTEHLVAAKSDKVLEVLRALIHYGNFIKNYDYVSEVLDIGESFSAMDTLYQRVGEQFGEEVQDEIFANITLPPLGVDPETKFEVTKIVMKRLEERLGEAQTIKLLAPCLHGREIEPSIKDRKELLRLKNIDAFLALKHQQIIERMQQHARNGTIEYAQYVDDDVINYVKNTLTISPGIRDGSRIIHTKIPYQIKKMLTADNDRMKRYYVCYCPWVRGAIKNGTDHEISSNFCHCSAGYTKKYWDIVFDQSVAIELIETALTGALHCKFAIQIPKDYEKFIK